MDHAETLLSTSAGRMHESELQKKPEPFPLIPNSETNLSIKARKLKFQVDAATVLAYSPLNYFLNGPAVLTNLGSLLRCARIVFSGISPSSYSTSELRSEQCGYSFMYIHYSPEGEKPEENKPANALILRLPHFTQDNVLGDTDPHKLESEMNYHILKDIQDRLKLSPHIEWILLDEHDFSRETIPVDIGNPLTDIPYDSVLTPHGYTLDEQKNEDVPQLLIPVTRDEFLDISLDTADLLDKFVEAIDDEELTALYEKTLFADISERHRLHQELIILVTRLLNAEIRFKLETDMYLSEPQFDKRLPRHTKLSQFITIRRSDPGFNVVRTAPRIGDARMTSLNAELQDLRGGIRAGKVEIQIDDILRTSDTPVRDILTQGSPFKRAQLLYLCDSLLRTDDIESLFKIHDSREATEQKMKEQSMYAIPAKEPNTKTSALTKARIFKRIGVNGLLMMAIFNVLGQAINSRYKMLEDIPQKPIKEESSAIPGELPRHIPQWHVEAVDSSIPLQGYWLEQTYDTFRPESATWIRQTKSKEVDFPTEIPDKYIKLTRPLMFHQATTIPVKQGTRLAAIVGRTQEGEAIDITTKIYPDGTVTAEYTGFPNPLNPAVIRLEIYLEQTDEPEKFDVRINSTQEKVDLAKSDPSLQELYALARVLAQEGHFEDNDHALAYLIQQRHTYGIDPDSRALAGSHSLEDFVNKASALTYMHCNTANTALALLSQDPDRTYVGGYGETFVNKHNPADGYLLASAGHGFTVDAEGVIRDATPFSIQGSNAPDSKPNIEDITTTWINDVDSRVSESVFNKDTRNLVKKAGIIAGSAIGLSLLARLTLRLKREAAEARRKPEVQQALDDEFLSSFEPEQVTRAVDFLLHISHHKEDVPYHDRDGLVLHEKPMDKIIQNCVIDRIRNYIVQPDSYEPEAWLKSQQKATRAIAGYVINVHEIFSSLKK